MLARWGVTAPLTTTTVNVRTRAEIPLLKSVRNSLSLGHRLLIIAPYPSLPGLKELINVWRKEANGNKIHLVMVAKDGNDNLAMDQLPNIELAFTVLDNVSRSVGLARTL